MSTPRPCPRPQPAALPGPLLLSWPVLTRSLLTRRLLTRSLLTGFLLVWALLASLPAHGLADEDCDCGEDGGGEAGPPGLPLVAPELLFDAVPGSPVRLDLFVMSLCPYGMQAQLAVAPLVQHWGTDLDFHLHFIAEETAVTDTGAAPTRPAGTGAEAVAPGRSKTRRAASPRRPGCAATGGPGPASGPFASLHGQPEVEENRRQLVIAARHGASLLPYLTCRAAAGPSGQWRPCVRAAGLDPDSLQTAALGPEGHDLLSANLRTANRLGIDLSPTLLIDGEEYTGRLDPFAMGRSLCERQPGVALCRQWPVCGRDEDCAPREGTVSLCLEGDTPEARCQHQPAVSFYLHVLLPAPELCPSCDAERFVSSTRVLFPGARVLRHGPGDEPGEADDVARRYGVDQFPAYILSEEFAGTARFERVRHLLLERSGAYVIRPRVVGTTYWPGRARRPGRYDLFLPADAFDTPAATRRWAVLEDDMLQAWQSRDEGAEGVADLRLHYMPPAGEDELGSPEHLRRLCLQDQNPQAYAAYAAARRAQWLEAAADTSWQAAAQLAGADVERLDRCAAGQRARRLVARVAARSDSLHLRRDEISALHQNQILTRGIQPEELVETWTAIAPP